MKHAYLLDRIPLDAVKSSVIRDGIAYWQGLCAGRAFPARADVAPKDFKKLLPNAIIAMVVDGGRDFEYRIAGESHTRSHRIPLQGRRITSLDVDPDYRTALKGLYDRVYQTRAPFALRGAIKAHDDSPTHFHSESAFLPLGPDGATVDHILVFSVYETTDGVKL